MVSQNWFILLSLNKPKLKLNPIIICLLLNHFRVVQNYEGPSLLEGEVTNFDDYNFLQQFNTRRDRSTNAESIQSGDVYSFQNADNDLYLTAIFSPNAIMPSIVHLKPWTDQASQLWEITSLKPNKGFSLKPLINEFNSITSQIVHKAHSYHSWEFDKIKKKDGKWMVKTFSNGKYLCLGLVVKKKPTGSITKLMKCNPGDNKQLWTIEDRF